MFIIQCPILWYAKVCALRVPILVDNMWSSTDVLSTRSCLADCTARHVEKCGMKMEDGESKWLLNRFLPSQMMSTGFRWCDITETHPCCPDPVSTLSWWSTSKGPFIGGLVVSSTCWSILFCSSTLYGSFSTLKPHILYFTWLIGFGEGPGSIDGLVVTERWRKSLYEKMVQSFFTNSWWQVPSVSYTFPLGWQNISS